MGTITFHPWPVRSDRRRPSRRAAPRPRPPAGHRLRRRRACRAGGARAAGASSATSGFPKTSGGRGIHIYVRIEPRWTFTDVRHAAIAFGRELERRLPDQVTTNWWKEERGERIFVDYNQNARDRTIASAYSIRPKPGAPVSAPMAWDELAEVAPEDFTVATMPARFAEIGRPPRRDRRASRIRSSRCWTCTSATSREGRATCPTRPTTRRCPASRSACSHRATGIARAAGEAASRDCGSFTAPRLVTGPDGGGTTGPISPSGASPGRRSPARGRSGPCPCGPGDRPTPP